MENLTEIESIALQEMQAGEADEVPTEPPIDQAEQLSELKKMDEEDNILPLKDNDNDDSKKIVTSDANNIEDEEDSDDESDEDVVVTIGEIKTTVAYQKPPSGSAGKIELDANPAYKGTPVYDLDLSSLEDKPWRKPGADITDYFNYGFNEDSWNLYCERQKKLRAEFGHGGQEAINRALFNNILVSSSSVSIPQQGGQHFTSTTGGRQLVVIGGGDPVIRAEQKVQKIVIDLTKPPPSHQTVNSPINPIPMYRTVIGPMGAVVSTQNLKQPPSSQPNFGDAPASPTFTSKSFESLPTHISSAMPIPSASLPITSSTISGSIQMQIKSELADSMPQINPTSTIPVLGGGRTETFQPLILPPQDFSKPPPSFDIPPPSIPSLQPPSTSAVQTPPISSSNVQQAPPPTITSMVPASQAQTQPPPAHIQTPKPSAVASSDLPPGVDEPEPPGMASTPPPLLNTNSRTQPPGSSMGGVFNPMGGTFNPKVPPPIIPAQFPASSLGFQGPAMFQQPSAQPPFASQFAGSQFVTGFSRLPGSIGHSFRRDSRPFYRPPYGGGDFANRRFDPHDSSGSDNEGDHHRKRRRRSSRSRSRSPLDRKREKESSRHHREHEGSKTSRRSTDSKEKEHKKSSRGDKDRSSDDHKKKRIKKERRDESEDKDRAKSPAPRDNIKKELMD